MEDLQAGGQAQEFIDFEAKLPPSRMMILHVILDEKRFIHEHAARA